MYPTIRITEAACDSASDLAQFLQRTKRETCEMLWLGDCGGFEYRSRSVPLSTFVLFWAPPNASENDVKTVLSSFSKGVVSIGCSTDDCIIGSKHRRGKWCAVVIESPYLTPHASFGELGQPGAAKKGLIDACVASFVDKLPEPYFTAGKAIG